MHFHVWGGSHSYRGKLAVGVSRYDFDYFKAIKERRPNKIHPEGD